MVDLPEVVQNVLSTRIDQLPPTMQMVLKVASVLGDRFERELLRAVFPVHKDLPSLDGYLLKLFKLGILRELQGGLEYQVCLRGVVSCHPFFAHFFFPTTKKVPFAIASCRRVQPPLVRAALEVAHECGGGTDPARSRNAHPRRIHRLALVSGRVRQP